MRFLFLAVLLMTNTVSAQNTLSPTKARAAEATMADWLAHPMEFGIKPARTTYIDSFVAPLAGEEKPITIHVVEYKMPDGTYGKGFVGPLTWSFVGKLPYDKLTNAQLVSAYTGSAHFPGHYVRQACASS